MNPKVAALSRGLGGEIGVDGRESTYFEYDPFPVRSASYAVSRIADTPISVRKTKRQKAFSNPPFGLPVLSFPARIGTTCLMW